MAMLRKWSLVVFVLAAIGPLTFVHTASAAQPRAAASQNHQHGPGAPYADEVKRGEFFTPSVTTSHSGRTILGIAVGGVPYAITSAQLTGNGIQDLVFGLAVNTADSVAVMMGNGDGTFGAPHTYALPSGQNPNFVLVRDFNGDGVPDLAVAAYNSGTSSGAVYVLLGNGDGTFGSATPYAPSVTCGPPPAPPCPRTPSWLTTADFNGDGKPDIAVSEANGGDYWIMTGKGDGTFNAGSPVAVGTLVNSVAAGDFNSDGKVDLAMAATYPDARVLIETGNGDGTFTAGTSVTLPSSGSSIRAADLNNDAKPDLFMSNGSGVTVLLGNGNGTFAAAATYPTGSGANWVVSGDANGDGIPDLATANSLANTASVIYGKGDGTFSSASSVSMRQGSSPDSLVLADFNGDGLGDLAVADNAGGQVEVFLAKHTRIFPWYDHAGSPNILNDNIHIINTAPVNAYGYLILGGDPATEQDFVLGPHQTRYFSWPGLFGGPVFIVTSEHVVASQRVQYGQSFNEVPSQGIGSGSTHLYFTWYDHISDAGFAAGSDNIHLYNPTGSDATVTVDIPGQPACHLSDTITAGTESVASCSTGFGGPVTITSTQPLIGSQRVVYYQTFNEVNAMLDYSATNNLVFTWYDHQSSIGFQNDNVHVINPAGPLSPAQVSVTIPGCTPGFSQASPSELIYRCPFGSGFGGPVTITGTIPVLASQRVQYFQTFNEVAAMAATSAAPRLWMPWYDHASSVGFQNDNLHVINPSGTLSPGQVSVTIPGCTPGVLQFSASELIYSCPFGSGLGGPVIISGSVPILASQRVQYYQSFNEAAAQT